MMKNSGKLWNNKITEIVELYKNVRDFELLAWLAS